MEDRSVSNPIDVLPTSQANPAPPPAEPVQEPIEKFYKMCPCCNRYPKFFSPEEDAPQGPRIRISGSDTETHRVFMSCSCGIQTRLTGSLQALLLLWNRRGGREFELDQNLAERLSRFELAR